MIMFVLFVIYCYLHINIRAMWFKPPGDLQSLQEKNKLDMKLTYFDELLDDKLPISRI